MESGKPLTEEDVQQCMVKAKSSQEKYTHIAFVETMTLGEATSNTWKHTGHQLHKVFSAICLISSYLPNTEDIKKEEKGDVPMVDHSSKVREGEEDEKSSPHPPIPFKFHGT